MRDDQHLFEMLCLEGAQAGLSWITVLRKRDTYRQAFDNFNAEKMLGYTAAKRRALLRNPGIIRNRLKLEAFIANAGAYLEIRASHGSFSDYLWQFTNGKVLRRRPLYLGGIAASSEQGDAMSNNLGKRGFKFVGPTICHAFMQAVGMVNEHQRYCWAASKETIK